jgi:VanZ family protein
MADMRDRDRMRKLMVRGLGWCLCLVLWTVALLTLFPVQVGQVVVPQTLHFPAAKFLHISVYAFLTVYLKWLPIGRGRWLLLAFLSLHAAGTEFFQQFVPGRHGMFNDVLIDHFGMALGLALTWKFWLPRPGNRLFRRESKVSKTELVRSPSGGD